MNLQNFAMIYYKTVRRNYLCTNSFILVIGLKKSNVFIFLHSKISWKLSLKHAYIMLTPLKPHFYILKLGFTGVYIIFLISD